MGGWGGGRLKIIIYIYIYIYICNVHTHTVHIYKYLYMYAHTHIYIIYIICTYEREREREIIIMKIVTLFPTAVAYKEVSGEVVLANTGIKYMHKEKKNYIILFSVFLSIFYLCAVGTHYQHLIIIIIISSSSSSSSSSYLWMVLGTSPKVTMDGCFYNHRQI